MTRGTEDWAERRALQTSYGGVDVGEVVPRLGGALSQDALGKAIWFESFEAALRGWTIVTDGTGAAITPSVDDAVHGSVAASLVSGTTAGKYAELIYYFPFMIATSAGLEIFFRPKSTDTRVSVDLVRFAGSTYLHARLELDLNAQTVKYQDSTGTMVAVPGFSAFSWNNKWSSVKIVADFDAGNYKSARFRGQIYDLSGIAMRSLGSAAEPHYRIQVRNTAPTTGGAQVFLDNILLTVDEP